MPRARNALARTNNLKPQAWLALVIKHQRLVSLMRLEAGPQLADTWLEVRNPHIKRDISTRQRDGRGIVLTKLSRDGVFKICYIPSVVYLIRIWVLPTPNASQNIQHPTVFLSISRIVLSS